METSPTGGQAGKPMLKLIQRTAEQTNGETMSEIKHSRSQVYFYPVNLLA